MPWSTVAWSESVDQAAIDNLAAVADQIAFTSGDNLRAPGNLIYGAYALGVSLTRAGLTGPSVRDKSNRIELQPIDRVAEPSSPHPFHDYFDRPFPIVEGEQLNGQGAEDGVGATRMSAFAWVGSGIDPAPAGEVFTVRATGTTTLVAFAWSAVTLTYDATLDVGTYHLVGARFESADAIVGRIVFAQGGPRPGAIGVDAVDDKDHMRLRHARAGSWGTFSDANPPSCEFFAGAANAAETVYFDLIGPV